MPWFIASACEEQYLHRLKPMRTHEILQTFWEKKKRSSPSLSIRGLADKLQISPSFLSRVLTGKRPIPYRLLIHFKKALEIDQEVFDSLLLAHTESYPSESVPVKGQREI